MQKKNEQIFFYIVFLILMIMLFCAYILKVDQDTRKNVKNLNYEKYWFLLKNP